MLCLRMRKLDHVIIFHQCSKHVCHYQCHRHTLRRTINIWSFVLLFVICRKQVLSLLSTESKVVFTLFYWYALKLYDVFGTWLICFCMRYWFKSELHRRIIFCSPWKYWFVSSYLSIYCISYFLQHALHVYVV